MSDYSEVIETRGDYRAVIYILGEDIPPESDGESPLMRIERGRIEHSRGKHYDSVPQVETAFDRWTNRPGDDGWKLFEKYLRAYLGVTALQTWQSEDVWYVAYDLPAWRKYIGLTEVEAGRDLFGDWKAYRDGQQIACELDLRRLLDRLTAGDDE